MMEILHNPRCGKSRQCLAFMTDNHKKFEIINYLEDKLTFDELTILLSKLKIKPIELVRQKEDIWKERFKNRQMSDKDIIESMVEFPILIQRPIVINGDNAYITRDNESLENLI